MFTFSSKNSPFNHAHSQNPKYYEQLYLCSFLNKNSHMLYDFLFYHLLKYLPFLLKQPACERVIGFLRDIKQFRDSLLFLNHGET